MTFCYFSCLGWYCFWPMSMAALQLLTLACWLYTTYLPLRVFNPHKISLTRSGSIGFFSSFRYTFTIYFSYKIGICFAFFQGLGGRQDPKRQSDLICKYIKWQHDFRQKQNKLDFWSTYKGSQIGQISIVPSYNGKKAKHPWLKAY